MEHKQAIAVGVVVAVGAAGVSPPETEGATMYTESNFQGTGESSRFVTMVHADIHRPPRHLAAWNVPIIPPGHNPLNITVDSPPGYDTYSLMGIAQDGGVFVTFADPSIALGRAFDEVFPGFSEEALADALRNEPEGQLVSLFMVALDETPGVGASMGTLAHAVHFSLGADYGTFHASFTPIPGPGAGALLAAGACFAARRRRTG